MKLSFHRQLTAIATVTTIALLGAASAHANRPAEMGEQAYRALVLRSEALNDAYVASRHGMSLAAYRALRLRSEALDRHYRGAAADVMPAAAYRALLMRSRALNERYGLGGVGQVRRSVAACGITPRHW